MALTHQSKPLEFDLFPGNSEMSARLRDFDWRKNPLGPPENWPQSLKTAVRIMLTSRHAMFIWWGESLINLYNDAYIAIVGGKHPEALGQPAEYVWREIWDEVGPRAESVMRKDEATYDEALLLIMERNGYQEETYYTFSYSPVPNDQGGTGGIICANTDETQRMIGERQLALLRELATRTADARTFEEACQLSARCLETNPQDLPFTLIYQVDPQDRSVHLVSTAGISTDHPAAPKQAGLSEGSVWPFAEVLQTGQTVLIPDLQKNFSALPRGAWEQAPRQAVAMPISQTGETGKAGILVVGLSPLRVFDENYQGFLNLVSGQIAASIANAQAYEEERKRVEALAEIDRAKTTFFNNVSHEFRTPLTLMLGPIEDALNDSASIPPVQRERLDIAHRNSLRLLKLVNTLLDFSRMEAGRIQAAFQPTDLGPFTAELASMFRAATEKAGLKLLVDCPPSSERAYIDRDMWEKIILNLLSNAFKHTFEGQIEVRLGYTEGWANLVVRDTGVGIPAEQVPELFRKFYQVDTSASRAHEGTGLGLALSKELVEIHGGHISVESEEGVGTTFTFRLPARMGASAGAEQ